MLLGFYLSLQGREMLRIVAEPLFPKKPQLSLAPDVSRNGEAGWCVQPLVAVGLEGCD